MFRIPIDRGRLRGYASLSLITVVSVLGVRALAGQPQGANVYAPFGCDLAAGECNDVGDSMLVRSARGVTMNIWTTGLEPHSVYTVWWVIFNNPAACAAGAGACVGPDLGNPDVNGCVQWATGHPIGRNGIGNFSASLQEGDTSGDQPNPALSGCGVGLVDADAAEVHLVVRTHGEIIPELVYEQMSTFLGGCDVNVCADQQFAIHP